MTPDALSLIIESLAAGCTRAVACKAARVSVADLAAACATDDDVAERVEAAEAEGGALVRGMMTPMQLRNVAARKGFVRWTRSGLVEQLRISARGIVFAKRSDGWHFVIHARPRKEDSAWRDSVKMFAAEEVSSDDTAKAMVP